MRSQGGELVPSMVAKAWKTALAASTDRATCERLKMALRTVTSRRNSRGSTDPTNAVTAATIGGWTIARAISSGKLRLRCTPLQAGTGINSTRVTAPAQSTSSPSTGHLKESRLFTTSTVPPTRVGTMTTSSKARSRRSELLLVTGAILSCLSLSGKQDQDVKSRYVVRRTPIVGLVPRLGVPR
jgi:hypothetical protein